MSSRVNSEFVEHSWATSHFCVVSVTFGLLAYVSVSFVVFVFVKLIINTQINSYSYIHFIIFVYKNKNQKKHLRKLDFFFIFQASSPV